MTATYERVLLAHGGGGSLSGTLIREIFLPAFHNEALARLADAAVLPPMRSGAGFAFTTDSYVISPPFFPGRGYRPAGSAGTVNDLAVSGADPAYLRCSLSWKEFPYGRPSVHRRFHWPPLAVEAGVALVTGDTKVVSERGGRHLHPRPPAWVFCAICLPVGEHPSPADAVLVSGTLGTTGLPCSLPAKALAFLRRFRVTAPHLAASSKTCSPPDPFCASCGRHSGWTSRYPQRARHRQALGRVP